jgi:peroxiredoxin
MSEIADLTEAAEAEWLESWEVGPTRTRWEHVPLQRGDAAPDAELPDESGAIRRLSDFWSHGPALLLFWRHAGCSCGIDRAARLKDEFADYKAAGATVVAIGMGEPLRAERYRSLHGLPCPILCDPERAVYQAFDLLEGSTAQVLFDAPDEFLARDREAGQSLAAQRHGSDRAAVDSPWQMPGEFVVGQDGIVRLAYRYQYCEDYPDPRVLLASLRFG